MSEERQLRMTNGELESIKREVKQSIEAVFELYNDLKTDLANLKAVFEQIEKNTRKK